MSFTTVRLNYLIASVLASASTEDTYSDFHRKWRISLMLSIFAIVFGVCFHMSYFIVRADKGKEFADCQFYPFIYSCDYDYYDYENNYE